MTPPQEHRLYQVILKQVLWDEDEAKIRKRLQVNEVSAEEAEAIYQAARKERVHLLRSRSRELIFMGLFALIAGCVVCGGFWYRLGAMHIGVLSGSGVFVVAGLALILKGLLDYLRAPRKGGSVADEV